MGTWGLGLGRPRTPLGRWIDKNEVTQMELHKWSGVSRPTITKMCNDQDYQPSDLSKRNIVAALRDKGYDVRIEDFW